MKYVYTWQPNANVGECQNIFSIYCVVSSSPLRPSSSLSLSKRKVDYITVHLFSHPLVNLSVFIILIILKNPLNIFILSTHMCVASDYRLKHVPLSDSQPLIGRIRWYWYMGRVDKWPWYVSNSMFFIVGFVQNFKYDNVLFSFFFNRTRCPMDFNVKLKTICQNHITSFVHFAQIPNLVNSGCIIENVIVRSFYVIFLLRFKLIANTKIHGLCIYDIDMCVCACECISSMFVVLVAWNNIFFHWLLLGAFICDMWHECMA